MRILSATPLYDPQLAISIAQVYREAFGGAPWNEGFLCPHCGGVFSLVPLISFCPDCERKSLVVSVEERWPVNRVVEDLRREMSKFGASCVTAHSDDNQVVGFAWGYRVSAGPDLDDHVEAPGLHHLIQGDFFYLDECAVSPEHQGKGLGKLLTESIFRGHKKVLLRTLSESRMCALINHLGGTIVQHISGGRVIMQLIAG